MATSRETPQHYATLLPLHTLIFKKDAREAPLPALRKCSVDIPPLSVPLSSLMRVLANARSSTHDCLTHTIREKRLRASQRNGLMYQFKNKPPCPGYIYSRFCIMDSKSLPPSAIDMRTSPKPRTQCVSKTFFTSGPCG